jgi:transposase
MTKVKRLQQFAVTLALYFSRAYAVLNHLRVVSTLDATVFSLLIPQDHLLVRINQKLDFHFVNALCHPYYKNSGVGNRPIEPVKLFKMLLVLVLYGLLSERELVRQVQVNVAFRSFCGFSLFDRIPDHSTFSVFRKRIGPQTFKAIFVHILEECIKAGLVTNDPAKAGCLIRRSFVLIAGKFLLRTKQRNSIVLSATSCLGRMRRRLRQNRKRLRLPVLRK